MGGSRYRIAKGGAQTIFILFTECEDMEAHHNEALRKQRTVEKKKEKKKPPAPNSFELVSCTRTHTHPIHFYI